MCAVCAASPHRKMSPETNHCWSLPETISLPLRSPLTSSALTAGHSKPCVLCPGRTPLGLNKNFHLVCIIVSAQKFIPAHPMTRFWHISSNLIGTPLGLNKNFHLVCIIVSAHKFIPAHTSVHPMTRFWHISSDLIGTPESRIDSFRLRMSPS